MCHDSKPSCRRRLHPRRSMHLGPRPRHQQRQNIACLPCQRAKTGDHASSRSELDHPHPSEIQPPYVSTGALGLALWRPVSYPERFVEDERIARAPPEGRHPSGHHWPQMRNIQQETEQHRNLSPNIMSPRRSSPHGTRPIIVPSRPARRSMPSYEPQLPMKRSAWRPLARHPLPALQPRTHHPPDKRSM